MSRKLGIIGIALASVLALGAFSCSSSNKNKNNTSAGGAGGAGGASSCGPTTTGFTGDCKAGAPQQCCAASLPVMTVRKNNQQVAPDWSCIGIGSAGGGGAGGSAGSGGAGGSAGSGGAGGSAGSAGSTGADAGVGGSDAGTAGSGGSDAGTAGSGGSAGASSDGGPPPNQNIFEVENFGSSGLVADVDVDLFEGDSIVDKTPFFSATTKGPSSGGPAELNNGQFYFPHPSSPIISYHVKAKPGTAKDFVGFGYEVPAPPGKVQGATVSPSLYTQLTTFAVPLPGWTPPKDLGIVTAPIRDCNGDDVGGAEFKLIDGTTGKQVQAGSCARDPRFIYFDSEYPNPKCQFTDYRQALMLVVNAPTNTTGADKGHVYKVQFFGRLRDTDKTPVMFAEKSVEIFPDSVNVYEIKPNVMQK